MTDKERDTFHNPDYVRASDVPAIVAKAIHPPKADESDYIKTVRGEAERQYREKFDNAVLAGEVTHRWPVTLEPVISPRVLWLQDACVKVTDVLGFLRKRELGYTIECRVCEALNTPVRGNSGINESSNENEGRYESRIPLRHREPHTQSQAVDNGLVADKSSCLDGIPGTEGGLGRHHASPKQGVMSMFPEIVLPCEMTYVLVGVDGGIDPPLFGGSARKADAGVRCLAWEA
jgi:hypothetical protein